MERQAIKTKGWTKLQNAILEAKTPEEKAQIYSMLFPEEKREEIYQQFLGTIEKLRSEGKIAASNE